MSSDEMPSPAAAGSARVVLLTTENVPRPYTVLTTLWAWGAGLTQAEEAVRRQAAALGADAVIGTQTQPGTNGQPAHCTGRAIRYKPLSSRPEASSAARPTPVSP